MLKFFEERVSSDIQGTIIDIETIGEFDESYPDDSRRYRNIIPVIFGYLTNSRLKICFVENRGGIPAFKEFLIYHIHKLERPLYAFNCRFEVGVLYNFCNLEINIERELNSQRGEAKWYVINNLGLDQYDDPFNGSGLACKNACLRGKTDDCIRHNRSCLLTERDVLQRRGYREPDEVKLVP